LEALTDLGLPSPTVAASRLIVQYWPRATESEEKFTALVSGVTRLAQTF
jgi:hypothetical protein